MGGTAGGVTFPDPDHSESEQRFVTFGFSERLAFLSWLTRSAMVESASSAPGRLRAANIETMKKATGKRRDELRPEYDFSKLAGGVRGKYYKRYRAGTNLVLLQPDVARAFPDGEAVNEALRVLMKAAARAKPRKRAKRT